MAIFNSSRYDPLELTGLFPTQFVDSATGEPIVREPVKTREEIYNELLSEAMNRHKAIIFSTDIARAKHECGNAKRTTTPMGRELVEPCNGCQNCVGEVLKAWCNAGHEPNVDCDACRYRPSRSITLQESPRGSFIFNASSGWGSSNRKFWDLANIESPNLDPEDVSYGEYEHEGTPLGIIDTSGEHGSGSLLNASGLEVDPGELAPMKRYEGEEGEEEHTSEEEFNTGKFPCPSCKDKKTSKGCPTCDGTREVCAECFNSLPVGQQCGSCGRHGTSVVMSTNVKESPLDSVTPGVQSDEDVAHSIDSLFNDGEGGTGIATDLGSKVIENSMDMPWANRNAIIGEETSEPKPAESDFVTVEKPDESFNSGGPHKNRSVVQVVNVDDPKALAGGIENRVLSGDALKREMESTETQTVYRRHPDDCICGGTNLINHIPELAARAEANGAKTVAAIKTNPNLSKAERAQQISIALREQYRCPEETAQVEVERPLSSMSKMDESGKPIFRRITGI